MNRAPRIKIDDVRSVVRLFTRGGLFWKYVAMFAAVLGRCSRRQRSRQYLGHVRGESSELAAAAEGAGRCSRDKISQFVEEIEAQLGWTTQLSWVSLLRSINASSTGADCCGRFLRSPSSCCLTREGGRKFTFRGRPRTVSTTRIISPTRRLRRPSREKPITVLFSFRRQTEPYMKLAVGGARRDNGVSIAEINLKHIWDVVTQIKVGQAR